jgi:signal transduction histidine kinase
MVTNAPSLAWVVVVLTITTTAVPAQGPSTSPLTEAEEAYLRSHGPLRVHLGPTGGPLTILGTDGRLRGIHNDIFALMSVRLGVEFNLSVADGVPNLTRALDEGRADIVGPATISTAGDRYWASDAYYVAAIGFWIREDGPRYARPLDLIGHRVGTPAVGFQQRLANAYPELSVQLVAGPRDGAEMLAAGELDALYAGYASVGYWRRTLDLEGLRTMGPPEEYVESHFLLSPSQPDVASILNKGLASISVEERLAIDYRWAGMSLAPGSNEPPVPFYRAPWFQGTLLVTAALTISLTTWAITLRREVRRRTAALHESERSLRQRTRQLEAAVADVESFNQSVAHDLRTPIRTVQGFSEVLLSPNAPEADVQRSLRIINEEAGRMSQIVHALLDLSQTSRQPVNRTPVDITSLAKDVLHRLQEGEPARKVEAIVDPGLRAHADPAQMRVVLENLVGNAWKFTAPRDVGRIEIGRDPERPDVFFVRDNGVGFPMPSEGLFQPFRRFHAPNAFEGTGIGLATVRRIVIRHGGKVWAESSVGGGATVFVQLPTAAHLDGDPGAQTASTRLPASSTRTPDPTP